MKFQFSFLTKFAAVAAVALSATQSFALTAMDETSVGAACEALYAQIAEVQKTKDPVLAKKVIEQRKTCDEQVAQAFDAVRAIKGDYYIFGFGVIVAGVEINAPWSLTGGFRFGVGGSAFLSDKRDVGYTGTRIAGLNVQKSVGGAISQIVEPQWGFIVYLGSKETTSLNQFNGVYGGFGFEMPNFRFSEQLNRSSLAINGYINPQGSIVIVGTKSFTAGAKTTAFSLQGIDIHNETADGGGHTFGQMLAVIGNDISKTFWAFKNLVTAKASKAFNR